MKSLLVTAVLFGFQATALFAAPEAEVEIKDGGATVDVIPLSAARETVTQSAGWLRDNSMNLLWFGIGAAISLAIAVIVFFVLRGILSGIAKKRGGNSGKLLAKKLPLPVGTAFFILGLLGSSAKVLAAMSEEPRNILLRAIWALFAFSVLWCLFAGIAVLDGVLRKRVLDGKTNLNQLLIDLIRKTLKVLLLVIALLFIFQNILGLDVTTLLAGAGVIGLAVAFAAQNTVANFISSIMVIMDKPFAVGDRIKVNGVDGCVEEVGLRSTRIRSLDGNQFALPNSMLADNAIENISRRPTLKYAFDLTLTYSTTPEKVREAIRLTHEILDKRPEFDMKNQPPLIFFGEFRDWALAVNVICWFNCDWNAFLQARNDINFEILEKFGKAGIDFAFPTSTTYLAGCPAEPVAVKTEQPSK
ncbi:MAG: mechanosensitive ion channel family protein [Victivallaceae bacterium]|nr:mechanosensitive ion channel family protein [Victivallaceae bacterium]